MTEKEKKPHLWDVRYREEGHLWGDTPSLTAQLLAEQLNAASRVLEVGFGYGRDVIELVQHGHQVLGVEESIAGLTEAVQQLIEKGRAGQAQLLWGEFTKAQISPESYDALMSHRMLHLLPDDSLVRAFANRAATVLKPGGALFVSARDERDFNPEQMEMVGPGRARYRTDLPQFANRAGHEVSFWSRDRFKAVFGKRFELMTFEEGQEIESKTNPNKMSHFTLMMAYRKDTLNGGPEPD